VVNTVAHNPQKFNPQIQGWIDSADIFSIVIYRLTYTSTHMNKHINMSSQDKKVFRKNEYFTEPSTGVI